MLPYFKLRSRKYISLVLDFTTLRDDFLILSASVSYMGRAIPVYMKMWRGVNESYDYWGRVESFLKDLKELLPLHQYWLIFDRGFSSKRLFEIIYNGSFGAKIEQIIINKGKAMKSKKMCIQ